MLHEDRLLLALDDETGVVRSALPARHDRGAGG